MKLTIFAPHQDDELNLFGTLFKQYLKSGFEITVIFVTNGDAYGIEKVRYFESEKIKSMFGINVLYCGFSDSGSEDLNKKTIYSFEDELYCSVSNHTKTYKPYEDEKLNFLPTILGHDYFSFNKSSMLTCFIEYLLNSKPEIIISTSWDNHPDHKIASSVLSEAIVNVCKKDASYRPLYLEGFSYLGNWLGRDDYFSPFPIETLPGKKTNSSFPFEWKKRIQIYTERNEISLRFWKSKAFQAYHAYTSVRGTRYFFKCANSDKCFWFRYTHNLALYSSIKCSSGNPIPLNDFKLLDTCNMRVHDFSINNKSLIHWTPAEDDLEPIIKIIFPESKNVREIIIHQGYGREKFDCLLIINGIEHKYKIDNYSYSIKFKEPVNTSYIEMKIIPFDDSAIAIREIEVFDGYHNKYLNAFLNCSSKNSKYKRLKLNIYLSKIIRKCYLFVESIKYSKIHKKRLLIKR